MSELRSLQLSSELGLSWNRQGLELAHINVILGENGTGKSRLLRFLSRGRNLVKNQNRVMWIEGTRLRDIPEKLQPNDAHIVSRGGTAPVTHFQVSTTDRVGHALARLAEDDVDALDKHAHEVRMWQQRLRTDEPVVPPSRLRVLFDVVERVLPHLRFAIEPERPVLEAGALRVMVSPHPARSGEGHRYPWTAMSDGEKEAVLLLAEAHTRMLVPEDQQPELAVVDEPARSLHPELAERLWAAVEGILGPDCRFVYATHSVHFATRPEVDRVFYLDRSTGLEPVNSLAQLDDRAKASLLGTLPMTSRGLLLCEGRLDAKFYSWLLEDQHIGVIPVAGCGGVTQNLKEPDELRRWAGRLAGVVDGDTLLEEPVQNLIRIRWHELECLLCHPKVVAALAPDISEAQVEQWLLGLTDKDLTACTRGHQGHLSESDIKKRLQAGRAENDAEGILEVVDGKPSNKMRKARVPALHGMLCQQLATPWADTHAQLTAIINADREVLIAIEPIALLREQLLAALDSQTRS